MLLDVAVFEDRLRSHGGNDDEDRRHSRQRELSEHIRRQKCAWRIQELQESQCCSRERRVAKEVRGISGD